MRRTFLKAVGLGIAIPTAYRMSRLAVAQQGPRPKRLFVFYLPHGLPIEHWDVAEDMNFSANGIGILSALQPYSEYVTVLRGVGINTSTNHAAIRSTITGSEGNNSIDFEIANALGSTAHVLGAHANPSGAGSDGQFANHGGWVDPVANPADALEDLFPGLSAGGTPVPEGPSDDSIFRAEGLALTEFELEAMSKELAGLTGEENKLRIHLESLRAYKQAQESGGGLGTISCETRPTLAAAESMTGKDPYDPANLGAVLDGHLEAAAQAMLCGTARIVTLQNLHANAQVRMDFPGGPGISEDHHAPLSHYSNGQAEGRAKFAEVQKWYFTKLVDKFVAVLDQDDPADPGRKVLDNTTILTMSEIVDGSNHTSAYSAQTWDVPGGPRETYLPTLIIGKGGGFFEGGKSVHVPATDHRDLLATVAHAMDVPLTQFGGTSVSPIEEVMA